MDVEEKHCQCAEIQEDELYPRLDWMKLLMNIKENRKI